MRILISLSDAQGVDFSKDHEVDTDPEQFTSQHAWRDFADKVRKVLFKNKGIVVHTPEEVFINVYGSKFAVWNKEKRKGAVSRKGKTVIVY